MEGDTLAEIIRMSLMEEKKSNLSGGKGESACIAEQRGQFGRFL